MSKLKATWGIDADCRYRAYVSGMDESTPYEEVRAAAVKILTDALYERMRRGSETMDSAYRRVNAYMNAAVALDSEASPADGEMQFVEYL